MKGWFKGSAGVSRAETYVIKHTNIRVAGRGGAPHDELEPIWANRPVQSGFPNKFLNAYAPRTASRQAQTQLNSRAAASQLRLGPRQRPIHPAVQRAGLPLNLGRTTAIASKYIAFRIYVS